MKILVTNDDGIDSPGVWALAEAMSRLGETLLVAPDTQRSGAGTSVSIHSGMSVVEVPSSIERVRAYAVGGTPTDCVIMGLWRLTQGDVDLIVSGINIGGNMGTDILYSGTDMATLQG
ncbi:MAG: 5'/3'-nucleotidase SurE, partial [Dehalococcoidia bacterium]